MKSLVLGGTGFVGRRLVEILVAAGNTVTVLKRGMTPVDRPLWNRTFDFGYEAEVAARVRNRLRRKDA